MKKKTIMALIVLFSGMDARALEFPGDANALSNPTLTERNGVFTLGNGALEFTYKKTDQGSVIWDGIAVHRSMGHEVSADRITDNGPLFVVELDNGQRLASSKMVLKKTRIRNIKATANAARLAERFSGKALELTFADADENLQVVWRAVLREGANAVKHEMTVTADKTPVNIVGLTFFDKLWTPGGRSKLSGYTDGSVVVNDFLFLGIEHPMAKMSAERKKSKLAAWSPREYKAGTMTVSLGKKGGAPFAAELEFLYEKGNHILGIESVDLLMDGQVVAADRHKGFTGNARSANSYVMTAPKGNAGKELAARITFLKTHETHSWGTVWISNPAQSGHVTGMLPRNFELKPGMTWDFSAVIGVIPAGQARRAFLYYLERERAHPHRLFFHYNSWYHLGIGMNDHPDPMKRMTETSALKALTDFGDAMTRKRGVSINSYVFDDGWDKWDSLWDYHKGFPNGFDPLYKEVKAQKSGIGAWLSPWGGYGQSHSARVAYGRRIGLETNAGGFSMAAPKYYAAFRDRCMQMIKDYEMNYFKFDGIGSGMWATGAPSSIAPDLDGLVRLTQELRVAKPDVFINCTVGTWASPFWMIYADSVWRQGEDCAYHGDGNHREKWITYRDMITYRRFVRETPFFPLNSLMVHGALVGDRHTPAPMPKGDAPEAVSSYAHEMWMVAASGTGLQELYITPELMTDKWWDITAEAIKWGRANADILTDSHWVGGDPEQAQVYGYAAWQPRKGLVAVRNPKDAPQTITGTLRQWLDLPREVKGDFKLMAAYSDGPWNSRILSVDEELTIPLGNLQVLILEAMPIDQPPYHPMQAPPNTSLKKQIPSSNTIR